MAGGAQARGQGRAGATGGEKAEVKTEVNPSLSLEARTEDAKANGGK